MNTIKKVFAVVSAVTAVMLMSTAVFAYTGNGTGKSPYIVKTEAELNECIAKGGYINLGNNISLNDGIEIKKDVTFDLCGYACTLPHIDGSTDVNMFLILNSAEFVINDSASSGSGALSTTGNKYTLIKCFSGKLTVNAGTFDSSNGNVITILSSSAAVINGGVFNAGSSNDTIIVSSAAAGSLTINGGTFTCETGRSSLYYNSPASSFISRINGGKFYRVTIKDNKSASIELVDCTIYNEIYCYNYGKYLGSYVQNGSLVYVDGKLKDITGKFNSLSGDEIRVINGTLTVTFDTGLYPTVPAPQSLEYASKAIEPEMPYDYKGKYVEGWYTNKKFKNKFSFDTPVKDDITLYAKWIKIDNEIDMTAEDGSTTKPVYYGDTVMLWANEVLNYKKAISWVVEYPLSNGRMRQYSTKSNAYAFLEMDPTQSPFDIILKGENTITVYAEGYDFSDEETTTDTLVLKVLYRQGDIDGNGKIEQTDAALYLKHLNGINEYQFTEAQFKRADANYDGNYDMLDVIAILNKTA